MNQILDPQLFASSLLFELPLPCNQKRGTRLDICLHFGFSLQPFQVEKPASVVQLDARPTGDQEVAGSTPAKVGNILSWRLIMKYFLRSFSPFR